ncbi:MAG TPA: hypothetical protein VFA38_04775 [Nitrospirales bacterium]|nr:hypothetical protein [Nitrospirales bacterium]
MKLCTPRRARRALRLLEDTIGSAKAAGLRYVREGTAGIRRKPAGHGFQYFGPDGKPVQDGETLRRIRSLAIPPAWTDVWISAVSNGHLQATGRDARGRKQYRYHTRWREARDETKYDKMIAFGRRLPLIRRRTARDLTAPGLSRRKLLATVVRLLESTLIRVGNDEYARANGSYGLTTMKDRHVDVSGSRLSFHFTGKSGKTHAIGLTDRRLARIVKQSRDLPGYELFQYVDEAGHRRTIDAADVNAYLREMTGQACTAKDFRTWAGTVLALTVLRQAVRATSRAQARRRLNRAIAEVAKKLGNTPTICRKCYIHPAIVEAYLEGTIEPAPPRRPATSARYGLSADERAALRLLERAARRPRRPPPADRKSLSLLLRRSLKRVRHNR